MNWPWKKPETRSSGYTDSLLSALLSNASGAVSTMELASIEAAAGLIGNSLAMADVTPKGPLTVGIGPRLLNLIARSLIYGGEFIGLIETNSRGLSILPASSWDVLGTSPDSMSWNYRIDLWGPSGGVTKMVGAESVIHIRYSSDPARPHRGVSPLARSQSTMDLAGRLESLLCGEAKRGGHVLPLPRVEDEQDNLKSSLQNLSGGLALVETAMAGFSEGRIAAPSGDYKQQRIGFDPPESHINLRGQLFESVVSACGVPITLIKPSDGSSQRESYRRWVLTTLSGGYAKPIEEELSLKLEQEISLDLGALSSWDKAAHTRGIKLLVDAGLSISEAFEVLGLTEPEN